MRISPCVQYCIIRLLCRPCCINLNHIHAFYNLDIPTIISGEIIAYLDPQEKVWPGQPGQKYTLDSLQKEKYRDALTPFVDISQFSRGLVYYPRTLFRFPLRTLPSALSENIYTEEKLEELIDALRGEAKLLLPFLRSVSTIEVHKISTDDSFTLLFRVEIASANKSSLAQKRQAFLQQLKIAHSRQSYGISSLIHFDADFHVEITDNITIQHGGSAHFLVSATVGSSSSVICNAATKQKVFPWIGTSLEIDSTVSKSGRLFCFLPMPVDAASNLPVHVNGTFGLNDDRRSMKWPGLERRNDPTADWNDLLVTQLLPACYVKLLLHAMKHLSVSQFYDAWPDVKIIKGSHWEKILHSLFVELFSHPVLWSERTEALIRTGEWVTHTNAFFTPPNQKLPSVLLRALCNCGLKLVSVPEKVRDAFEVAHISVNEISPRLARDKFKSNVNSYSSIDETGKHILLNYCTADKCYNELHGIALLPLANGNFVQFQQRNNFGNSVYLCSSDCPHYLLPNLDHKLVNVSDDLSVNASLKDIAESKQTQLVKLTVDGVSSLLPQSMPSSWQKCTEVSLNDSIFPTDWFEKFWVWASNHNLEIFGKQFLLPVGRNNIVRLAKNEMVVYVPQSSSHSQELLAAFDKLGVKYCLQDRFPYVHHKQLSSFICQFNTDDILDSVFNANQFTSVVLKSDEAKALRSQLYKTKLSLTHNRECVLKGLPIFLTASNSQYGLHSPNTVAAGLLKKAIIEPSNLSAIIDNLPNNFLLFSCNHYNSIHLLNNVGVQDPTDITFLVDSLFPLIKNGIIHDRYIDPIMNEILHLGPSLVARDHLNTFCLTLSQLAFVRTASGHRCSPSSLFDPSNHLINAMYEGESIFPVEPYNTTEWLQFLRQSCSLHTSVTPEEILAIISDIKRPARETPQKVSDNLLSRAKAVLQYISTDEFQTRATGSYSVVGYRGYIPFSTALNSLSSSYSWLPVQSQRPVDYPSDVQWKGEGYTSHFFTLDDQGVVVSSSNKEWLPYVAGSQLYMTDHRYTPNTQLAMNESSICVHAVNHLQLLASGCTANAQLSTIMDKVYAFLHRQSKINLVSLKSVKEWIFMRRNNLFVSSNIVSIRMNSSFGRDLEPYLYVLPDSLSPYKSLFTEFGVVETMSRSQIIAVLGKIKQSIGENDIPLSASNLWDIVMSILNWLTKNATEKAQLNAEDELYVPIESNSEWPQLMCATDVVYTDNDFLKNFLSSSGTDESYSFVHKSISVNMAVCLDLTPLSDFLDITEDTFEDTGQYEPLTVRLKNILRDYKEGLTIVKELLQNADDAEATEVNFCYDARTHSVDPNSLFFPDMLPSHGPALIVHNNKCFSKDDFENITKLAGGTKQNKPLKIGKFGIGFCSVYHITDVPSFVSSDSLVVFDPTMNYLKKEIKNPSRPGKKVKFTSPFIRRSKQLIPYDGLFGFDSQQEYNGTMFRLPFRSSQSELSGVLYTENHHIKQLMSDMKECCSNLILFLQYVKTITFQVIKPGEAFPTVRLEITKSDLSLPCLPSGTSLKEIVTTSSESQFISSHFVVSSDSVNVGDKHATASIAASLVRQPSGSYAVNDTLEGEVFCFLPLSQITGLPVHVSANFAVISNRRGIWTSDDASSQSNEEVQWNKSLMQSVIPTAYHQLLLAMQALHNDSSIENYIFYHLWPLETLLKLKNPWGEMISRVYAMVTSAILFYSDSMMKWLCLNESKFLAPYILSNPSTSAEDNEDILISSVLQHLNVPLVLLPMKYRQYFELATYTIYENDFLLMFFENLEQLNTIKEARDEIVLRMLEVYAAEHDSDNERYHNLQNCFKVYPCIPCAPDGSMMKKCSDLIDPNSPFAGLYDIEDQRFPITKLTQQLFARTSLIELGMIHDKLPYSDVVVKAQTFVELYNQNRSKALCRIKLMLKTIEFHMDDKRAVDVATLDSVPFLLALPMPSGYPISWAGDNDKLMCGRDAMVYCTSRTSPNENNGIIAGSQVMFINEGTEDGCGKVSDKVQSILKVRLSPNCAEVILHLKEIIQTVGSATAPKHLKSWVDHMCRQIYKFLDQRSDEEDILLIKDVSKLPCVWNGQKFLNVQQIATKWTIIDGPYLYCVPSVLSLRHSLCDMLNVSEDFSTAEIEAALKDMKRDFGNKPVDERSQQILKQLVTYFLRFKPDHFDDDFNILLPDENYVLNWSTDLAFNDAPWAPKDESYRYVNDIIPRKTALQLHVKPVRSKLLDKYVNTDSQFSGVEFGQRETLTRRIQNILRDYPFDVTLLKELLQNADDAKASKMCVILDKRKHGEESIISKNWQKLQGPAVLVWNNSIFTEKDFKGIQDLGLGSKRSDAESIGQYGIGFNSVYHLTDCPSFVSNGDTLCVLDPHCTFVHGATPLSPGRRYDHLKSGFWDVFKDMKSAYLRSGIDNLPDELLGGSLFRFPLRSTQDAIKNSKIVADSTPITATKMQHYLDDWAPDMKDAMFFLNNVREIRFCVIEKDSKLQTLKHFNIDIDPTDQSKCTDLCRSIYVFREQRGCEPCIISYPITISEVSNSNTSREMRFKEKWLIQQGVGDVQKRNQTWAFVKNVKPRHGIAALMGDHRFFSDDRKVFCFLPLPITSRLPVHVNGHFILDSTRRNLWNTTNPGRDDGHSVWNKNLLSAIASSYAILFDNAKHYYVCGDYESLESLYEDVKFFYTIQPKATASCLHEPWLALARECYRNIYKSNLNVLAVIKRTETPTNPESAEKYLVAWHPVKCTSLSAQAYFSSLTNQEKAIIHPVLSAIGMVVTIAPYTLREYLNNEIDDCASKCPEISPESVYSYYRHLHSQVASQFPCDIVLTSFKSVENFKVFINFVLQKSRECNNNSELLEFPSTPFGYPLLLTADGVLRKFDECQKVICSQFVGLFPNSAGSFLHSSLLDIKFSKDYFANERDSGVMIHQVLTENLPECLCDTRKCSDAATLYPIQQLQQLWHCFSFDPIFKINLSSILNRWALILTQDNQLFSNTSQLRPVIPTDENTYLAEFQLLKRIGMPIVDTSVVVVINNTTMKCPALSNTAGILNSLFHLAQETNLTEKLSDEDIKILINYLRSINYRIQQDCCRQVKSLPLFENVAGEFVTLYGVSAFLWPRGSSCLVAYKKWVRGYSVVFLKPYASWVQLCSSRDLGIQDMEIEDIYVRFVFPHFDLMAESERYEHLRFIRDSLFSVNKVRSQTRSKFYDHDDHLYIRATNFLMALRELKCIGSDGRPLQKVGDFCDHERKIFTTFSQHFQFLPTYFTNSPQETILWMRFFRELGLKTTIAHDEFITFCTETAQGQVSDVREASSVLVNSLFSSKPQWHSKHNFLTQVSQIGFLCSEKLPSLAWIAPVLKIRTIQPRGDEAIEMTEPCKSAVSNVSTLVWTVKPTVSLPYEEKNICTNLSICTEPIIHDVIQNLKNICQGSRFADIRLFDKYSSDARCPDDAKSLSDVIMEHFSYLYSKESSLSSIDIYSLQEMPCIPVHASPQSSQSCDVVLVKPRCVVTCRDAVDYHPFLHQLPQTFIRYSQFFAKLGVEHNLNIKHMQIVLESAYKCAAGEEVDPNTSECVKKAIKFIYKALKDNEDSTNPVDLSKNLSPLYLPSTNGTLVLSTRLIYQDQACFSDKTLDLGETEYTELNITFCHYTFHQTQFCDLLPICIRPKGTSQLCSVKVAAECRACDQCELAKKLSTTLELSTLSKAVVTLIKHNQPKGKKIDDQLQQQMDSFLRSIKIVTCNNLLVDITLKDTNSAIGKVKLQHFLDKHELKHTMYIDRALTSRTQVHYMFSDLVDLFFSSVKEYCSFTLPFSIKSILEFFLMAESDADIIHELQRNQLPTTDIEGEEVVQFSLGKEIPQEWHYRLDQDINNLFHPNEYVGYEVDEGHIIIVKIVHLIDDQSPLNGSRYARKYLVYTSENDIIGTEVSVLTLYKFTKGEKKELQAAQQSQSVVPYEGEVNLGTTTSKYDESSLKIIKKGLCVELKEVWKLDLPSRKRAIRRLYLKWHPDRNPDNPEFAEKVFKFLLAQIEKLESGLPLDDPDRENTSTASSGHGHSGGGSAWWGSFFRRWNYTAREHHRTRARHYRPGGFRPTFSFGGRHSPQFSGTIFREPTQPEEGRRWMRQAFIDHDVLNIVFDQSVASNNEKSAGHICFMAHQVAEKALKAAMYAICGLDERRRDDCNLTRLAYSLQTEKPSQTTDLACSAAVLESYYLDTRYPHRHPSPTIPADVYSLEKAQEAKECADKVFSIVQVLFDSL